MLRGENHKSYKRASIKAYLLLQGLSVNVPYKSVDIPNVRVNMALKVSQFLTLPLKSAYVIYEWYLSQNLVNIVQPFGTMFFDITGFKVVFEPFIIANQTEISHNGW